MKFLAAALGTFLLATPAMTSPPPPLQPAARQWTFTPEKDFDWWKQTPPGWLLIGNKDVLMGVEPDSGKVAWRRTDLKGLNRHTLRFFPPTPLALVNVAKPNPRSILFDVTTGREMWATDSLGMEMADIARLVPGRAAAFLVGRSRGSKKIITMAVSLPAGHVLWKSEALDRGREYAEDDTMSCLVMKNPPTYLFDTDSTLIAFCDSRTVRRVNFLADRIEWEVPVPRSQKNRGFIKTLFSSRSEPRVESDLPFRRAEGFLSRDRTRFYLPHHNTITAFRTSDGAPLWEHDPDFEGVVEDMIDTGDAIVARVLLDSPCGHWRLACVDVETGTVRFDYPSKTVKASKLFSSMLGWETCTNLLAVDDELIVGDDKQIHRIRLADGTEETPIPVDFECCDKPVLIEPVEGGYLVAGEQNAVWFDEGWLPSHRIYHPEPTNISLGLGILALSVTFDAIGDIDIGRHATLSVGSYELAFKELMTEFHSTSDARRYLFMLSDPEEGEDGVAPELRGQFVFVVDKSTRETIAALPAEKKPDYKVDPWNRHVFFKISDRRIDCYGF